MPGPPDIGPFSDEGCLGLFILVLSIPVAVIGAIVAMITAST